MSEKQKKEEKQIFNAALKLKTAAERIAYIEKVCDNDLELKARILALLHANEEKGDFLDVLIDHSDINLGKSPFTEKPGTKIGHYKLLELIGEGGFGMVYMAEQEEPIRRRVALKIIKLGMDTKQVIARFEAERQALAMMDHPNIAKVLDAGATETGRPYFVMELVRGIPITEYCDKNNLDTRQRLQVFIDVCKAIQHAHQKGIIHRDLKPSNVMITLRDDDSPVPKIIDFGIAKATQARLTEKTLFTGFKQFIGTQEYMSPEQARMGELDVDTRSDIYSLGVLLYELLTGTTPFEARQLRSAAFDEIVRIIRDEEPDKPSTRLSTLGGALTEIAKHRHVEPAELRKIVRGDLDWIVMKALEKDRTRRYETASEFAMDILRYLSNEPVHASPPSMIYKMRKYIRRHRTSVVVGLLFMTSLIIGFSLAIAGFVQASHQRDLAEANFRKAREAVDQMLTQVAEELPRLPGISKQLDSTEVTKIKQALLENALKYYEGFLEERSSDLNIRYETAHAYMRVGDITRSMDQDKRAEETYFAAANLLEELVAEFPNEFDYHKDLAFAYHGYGDMLRNAGRTKEKNDVYRKSAISYENAFKLNQNDAYSWFDCADVYRAIEQWHKAIADLSEAIELEPDNANYWCIRADTYNEIGQKDKADADYSKAIELYSKVIELRPRAYRIWTERANVYRELEQWDDALADYSKAIELNPGFSWSCSERANLYRELEQWHDALADYSKAIELNPDNVWDWFNRAGVYRELEQWDDALADYSKAIELEPYNWGYWLSRAEVYYELDQKDKADAEYSKAIELYSKAIELNPNNVEYCLSRAYVYRELEQWDQAIADLSKVIELDPGNADYWSERAEVYNEIGQRDKANADYSKAIELYSKAIERDPNNVEYWLSRANVYIELEQLDKALTDCNKAIELCPGNAGCWSGRAEVYRQLEQWDDALDDSSKAIELEPNAHWLWGRRANVYRNLKQFDNAIADSSKAIELDPSDSWPWSIRADVFRELEQWENAVADYNKAIELDPNNSARWYSRGVNYQNMEQWDEAIADFSRAIELDPNDSGRWIARANVYRALEQWDKALTDYSKAIELYSKAIELDPDNAEYWSERANTYSSMEQWNEAIANYSQAIELDPNNATVHYWRALTHLGTGDTEGYRSLCARMLDQFGHTEDAAAAHWAAWTCALAPDAVEDINRVMELAELAIEKGEQTDQNRNALRAVLYRTCRFDEAIQELSGLATEWEQGKELPTLTSPAYTWFFLSMTHHQLGNADQAKYWFDKALERTEEELQGVAVWNRRLTLELLREEVTQLLDISQETKITENNE